ncbi:protein GLE1 isoform X1 [Senna tora]|uniref:mRNA export factor GLE1 n=1 Tax=Senna tora TaxID=362788 RepID=A0A834WXM2_9FABA|nr:protein GLE1 isoform X1 [Senna tora]
MLFEKPKWVYICRGAVKLDLRCPQRVDGVAADPEPDWSFDALLSELNALEMKLTASFTDPSPTKTTPRGLSRENEIERSRPFILNAPDYEMEDTESEDEQDKAIVGGKRFSCDELYLSDSDDSDVVSAFDVQPLLMEEAGEVEGALFELTHEHQLRVKDEIRSQISALETSLMNESEKSASALRRVEKYKEARQELDRKFDTQYQRRIAEVLDNHLTAVQQERELKSQIEERKIRNDAAYEEAKRKEKALQEEKLRQEKAKAEAEAKLKAEEAKQAALEAERRAAIEAEKRAAKEAETRAAKEAKDRDAASSSQGITSGGMQQAAVHPTDGYVYRAADSALTVERERLQKLKEIFERNQAIRSSSNQNYTPKENHIARLIRQIRGVTDNVRSKAGDLIKLLNDSQCPQSISVEIFARKVVSYCENPGNAAFASGYVIVLVTAQVPQLMDILLAELHKACIYTVPKHLVYKQSTFESREAYFKRIGYRESDGNIESTEDYLKRLESYIKVYGALVQTEIPNVRNLHGLEAGWAWLARFLNTLPANKYTAVSLNAFLQMAGFALYRRYKSHFLKLLKVISDNFLVALKQKEPAMTRTIVEIQSYIEDKKFLQEPEGKSLQSNLLSSVWRS